MEDRLFKGRPDVVDADLADYFGSIPHAELLKSVPRRIVDRRVLHLIKQWLECVVEETDKRGRKTRTTEARDKAVVALSVYSRLDTNGGSYCTPSAKYRVGLRAISRAARNWA